MFKFFFGYVLGYKCKVYNHHTPIETNIPKLPMNDDWIIGGSYALKLLTKADWKNDDIDIFVRINYNDGFLSNDKFDKKKLHDRTIEFIKKVSNEIKEELSLTKINISNLRKNLNDSEINILVNDINNIEEIKGKNCEIVDYLDQNESSPNESNPDVKITVNEEFHNSIIGTMNYKDSNDNKYQFVGVLSTDMVDLLIDICDVPSVFMLPNNKTFIIPNKCINSLITKEINSDNICVSRKNKYSKRSFIFY